MDRKISLEELTTFNIRARYPDYKNRFQKKASREFTENQLSKVEEIRQWLMEKINS